ncbi:MAG: hypothetical protein WBV55_24290 [Candidatus Sulfotelmatobacter sp.]
MSSVKFVLGDPIFAFPRKGVRSRALCYFIIRTLIQLGILKKDINYHLVPALMVSICSFFGYQKWFNYEAQA